MRIGTVCFCTRQGIGWLPKWFYDNGIITDAVLLRHHCRHNHTEWYPDGTPVVNSRPFSQHQCIRDMLDRVDAMLFIETPFDWEIIMVARDFRKKTAIMPMYECTPVSRPYEPDLWLCPSLLDCEYFPNHPFVEVPVPDVFRERWRLRERALKFLHNGGNLGLRGHKGTLELLQAMKFVQSPIELKVTAQDAVGLQAIIKKVPEIEKDRRVTFDTSDVPHETLYDDHDVFIMAEKYNGLSLPLREARAAGMLVMTSDRFPMNTWLPTWPLIYVHGWQKARISGGYLEYDEAIVHPSDIAAAIDRMFNRSLHAEGMEAIRNYSLSGKEWAEKHSWEALRPSIVEALEKGLT